MPLWTGQPLAYPTVQKTGAAAYRFHDAGRFERTDQLSDPDPDVAFLPN
jgi:hypothetical protein